jgi:hypothetical protein
MKPSSSLQSTVRSLVDKIQLRPAADHLEISYESLKSVCAGYEVRAGTIAQIEKMLQKPLPTNGAAKKKPAKAKKAKKK